MRYAPSERFWRNFLLTCVFTGFTLGFSVASWNGLSPRPASIDQAPGKETSAGASGVVDLATPRADFARTSGGSLQELGIGDVAPPASFAGATGGGNDAAVASAKEFGGGIRDLSQRGHSASSSSRSTSGARPSGGFPGPSFGRTAKKDYVGQTTVKTSPSVAGKSNTKGNGKKGGSSKTKKDKPTDARSRERAPEGVLAGEPAARYANATSPASTPEPLSMLLVGTGLAGLYRARKYLR